MPAPGLVPQVLGTWYQAIDLVIVSEPGQWSGTWPRRIESLHQSSKSDPGNWYWYWLINQLKWNSLAQFVSCQSFQSASHHLSLWNLEASSRGHLHGTWGETPCRRCGSHFSISQPGVSPDTSHLTQGVAENHHVRLICHLQRSSSCRTRLLELYLERRKDICSEKKTL